VVCVQKEPGGPYRFCVDYSKLTPHTIPDPFPLPRIEDTIDHLAGHRIFTVVDAQKGFWQIPINEDDREKLAFITSFGKYQWNVLPFGYTLAPGIFQRAMNETLDELLYFKCLVYIDDIIIFSKNYDQHLQDIEEVFERLRIFNWKLKLDKCKFAQTKMQYLGHIISEGQIQMFPKNLKKIQSLKPPKNIKETQQFLGVINYYRRFIQGLSYLTEPILINLRDAKNSKFIWEEEQQKAYSKILRKFAEEPILKMPDYTKPFILKTDASDLGFGGVLAQDYDGVEHPIAFFSGSFNSAQRKYSSWEREALAVILGVKRFHHFLQPAPFTIVTDNKINTYLLKPNQPLTNARTTRWQLFLGQYKYKIVHRPGEELYLEDGLSRAIINHLVTKNDIHKQQKEDELIKDLIRIISNEAVSNEVASNIFKNYHNNLIVENDILYYHSQQKGTNRDEKRIVIPSSLQQEIIKSYHDLPSAGHLATLKTFSRLIQHVWFPSMFSKVKKYCEECKLCDQNRRFFKVNDTLKPIISTRPMETLIIDHCGKFTKTKKGNKYVLTVVDHFTRKRWFLPVPSTSGKDAFQALQTHVFCPFEFPRLLITDKGSAFTSQIAVDFAKIANYEISFALPDQHRTAGSAEISNRIMEDIIKKYIDQIHQNDWDEYLSLAAFALNKSISSTHGFSPDFLFFGREPINPFVENQESLSMLDFINDQKEALDLAFKIANERLAIYRQKMESKHLNINRKFTKFSIGDWVYLKKPLEAVQKGSSHKLDHTALGPFKVVSVDSTKGNVSILLAPESPLEVKNNMIRLSKNQEILLDDSKLKASKTSEILVLQNLSEITKIQQTSNKDLNKKKMNTKTLVGKRVAVFWKTGPYKGWHNGTIVGYNSNLKKNLIYYDTRNVNVNPTIDYYAEDFSLDSRLTWKFI
jgi:hypothetical protein